MLIKGTDVLKVLSNLESTLAENQALTCCCGKQGKDFWNLEVVRSVSPQQPCHHFLHLSLF